jgi:hypothetical protein
MSWVTNVILKTAPGDAKTIQSLNERLRLKEWGERFVSCEDQSMPMGWYAGDKGLEIAIFPGAFNHLDMAELVSAIQAVPWKWPNQVQLFAQEDNSERMVEVPLRFMGTGS